MTNASAKGTSTWGKKFFKNVSLLAGATALSQGLTVIVSPLLTRLYTPEDFGIFAIFMSTITLATTVGGLRYDMAIPICKNEGEAARLVVITLLCVAGMTSLISLALLAASDYLAEAIGVPEFAPYVWFVPIGLIFSGTYQALNFGAIRMRSFKVIAATKLQQGIGRVLVQVGFGVLSPSPIGLVIGHIVGIGSGAVRLAKEIVRFIKESKPSFETKRILETAREYYKYPVFMSGASLLNAAGIQIVPVLLSIHFGTATAGVYFLTNKVVGLPLQLIGRSVSQVFLGEAAEVGRRDKTQLQKIFVKVSLRLLIIAIVPAVILVAFGPILFELIFGEIWRESGVFARYLAIVFVLKLSFDSTINLTLVAQEKLSLCWSIFRLAAVYASITIPASYGQSPVEVVPWIALAMSVSYIVKVGIWLGALRKYNVKDETKSADGN